MNGNRDSKVIVHSGRDWDDEVMNESVHISDGDDKRRVPKLDLNSSVRRSADLNERLSVKRKVNKGRNNDWPSFDAKVRARTENNECHFGSLKGELGSKGNDKKTFLKLKRNNLWFASQDHLNESENKKMNDDHLRETKHDGKKKIHLKKNNSRCKITPTTLSVCQSIGGFSVKHDELVSFEKMKLQGEAHRKFGEQLRRNKSKNVS